MGKIDRLFATYQMTQLVTLVYLVLAPDSVTFVNAGHPPPLVLTAGGTASALPIADGPPLGTSVSDRTSRTAPFGPGDTLVAFTDGLVERRSEDIDAGLARLLAHVPGLNRGPLSEALAVLIDEVRDHSRDDDVAALAVRQD